MRAFRRRRELGGGVGAPLIIDGEVIVEIAPSGGTIDRDVVILAAR
jgi:hypothetical protein